MRRIYRVLVLCVSAVTVLSPVTAAEQEHSASGAKGLVVSGRAAATAAGIRMLEVGGNAADAGAATLLALSVTQVGAFCIGGEVPVLIYDAAKKDVELERLKMAIRDNIVTTEVKANGFGAVDTERLDRAIDQIATTYEFRSKPKATDVFDGAFLPSVAERTAN
jgi:hypothetical protein